MLDVPLLPYVHMRRIEPFFLRSRGPRRVDDRRIMSGIVYVIRQVLSSLVSMADLVAAGRLT